ncbi:MAG TPA: flagellar basal body rod protein FlgB [Lacipirellulaceae bacterium]|jgi:flagellar basal-body rod protein FlgB
MLSSLLNSTTIPLLEQVVNFTETRHGVLAGNIANMDTPGYHTRDLSTEKFQANLKEAVAAQHAPASSADKYGSLPSYGGGAANSSLDPYRNVKDSLKDILYHDNSDVSMEQQVNEIVKNQTEHNMAIDIMAAQLRLLRAAVTERVA